MNVGFFSYINLGGDEMARVRARSHKVNEMARIIKQKQKAKEKQGILYVGNVIINRVVAQYFISKMYPLFMINISSTRRKFFF